MRQHNADELRPEYDFAGGVRGKYAMRFAKGTNLVLLDPDIAKVFPTGAAVNRALRAIIDIAPTRVPRRRSSDPR
ncbi:MAG: hypothetical protein NW201_01785 [Gemmatimonadales bacterium]|nr:hypothetical protein [Gemmatimonadales bacterium]